MLDAYPSVRDVVWLQEEPENMGAWEFMRPLLEELIGDRCPLRYIGRARSASPSEGSAAWHQLNQKALVERAFDLDSHASESPMVLSKPAPRSLTERPKRVTVQSMSNIVVPSSVNRSSRRASRAG